jgi:hypothetical protein
VRRKPSSSWRRAAANPPAAASFVGRSNVLLHVNDRCNRVEAITTSASELTGANPIAASHGLRERHCASGTHLVEPCCATGDR